MKNAEASLQAEIVADIRQSHPEAIVFAVPNDGLYTAREAAKRRWTGVLAGMPDLIVLAPGARIVALEVKQRGCGLSADQARMFIRLHDAGVLACIVRSVDEARAALAECGITPGGVGG